MVDFRVVLKKCQHDLPWNFSHTHAINSLDAYGPAITKQIKASRKVIATLPVGNDDFITLMMASTNRSVPCNLYKSFKNNMKSLT